MLASTTPVSWYWPAGIGLLLSFALVLILWSPNRTRYVAAVLTLLAIGVVTIWFRTRRSIEDFALRRTGVTPSAVIYRVLVLHSQSGGIQMHFQQGAVHTPESVRKATGGLEYVWVRRPLPSGEGPARAEVDADARPGILIERWGFQLVIVNRPDNPRGATATHFWAITMPHWALTIGLLVMPTWWLAGRKRRLRKYRRKRNLCETCGYSLQGLSEPTRCPECGTAAPQTKGSPPAPATG